LFWTLTPKRPPCLVSLQAVVIAAAFTRLSDLPLG
jgi:hypothetical protein